MLSSNSSLEISALDVEAESVLRNDKKGKGKEGQVDSKNGDALNTNSKRRRRKRREKKALKNVKVCELHSLQISGQN